MEWEIVYHGDNVQQKSAKTPARELKLARERMREVQANDDP
jgi:phage-related protein